MVEQEAMDVSALINQGGSVNLDKSTSIRHANNLDFGIFLDEV